jgi:hypothetical protein
MKPSRASPSPVEGRLAGGAHGGRQQRVEQPHRQFAGLDALVALLVLVDHGRRRAVGAAARLAEGDVLAGDVLQLDGHVLEHMAEPGALVLGMRRMKPPGSP